MFNVWNVTFWLKWPYGRPFVQGVQPHHVQKNLYVKHLRYEEHEGYLVPELDADNLHFDGANLG